MQSATSVRAGNKRPAPPSDSPSIPNFKHSVNNCHKRPHYYASSSPSLPASLSSSLHAAAPPALPRGVSRADSHTTQQQSRPTAAASHTRFRSRKELNIARDAYNRREAARIKAAIEHNNLEVARIKESRNRSTKEENNNHTNSKEQEQGDQRNANSAGTTMLEPSQ